MATTTTVAYRQLILQVAVLARKTTKSFQLVLLSVTVPANVRRRRASKKCWPVIRVLEIAPVARKLNAFNKL